MPELFAQKLCPFGHSLEGGRGEIYTSGMEFASAILIRVIFKLPTYILQ